jgi:hypothetical protein
MKRISGWMMAMMAVGVVGAATLARSAWSDLPGTRGGPAPAKQSSVRFGPENATQAYTATCQVQLTSGPGAVHVNLTTFNPDENTTYRTIL